VEPSIKYIDKLQDVAWSSPMTRDKLALSPQSQWLLLLISLILIDLVMIGIGFWFAHLIRFQSYLPIFRLEVAPATPFYRGISMALIPVWLGVFTASGLYHRRNLLGGTLEYSLIFRATSIGMILVIVAGFLQPDFVLARGWLLLSWVFAFLFVASARFVVRRLVYSARKRGYYLSPALIVGANEEGYSLADQLLGWRTSGLLVMGFIDDKAKPGTAVHQNLKSLGNFEQLDVLIEKYRIEELILATSALSREEMLDIFEKYGLVDGLNLRMSSGLFEVITTGLEVKELAFTSLYRVQKVRLTGLDRVLKLMLDYALTIPGLIAITPLLLIIGVAIKFDSPGPVFYRRRVMGINGKEFYAFKFRTMHVNGDRLLNTYPELKRELARNHKLKNDPRVTRVGRILRQSSLDELPQLLNVLFRQMSLVGPRIISPAEMTMYCKWGMNLLTVPPGITGLWQVSGRSDISYEERVRLDMHYVRNWTIWLDVQLLWQTIPAVIKGRGAY
jgi:exopolysaccharide biosynthesis polyprenyl glycosylphosphotransferase